MRCSSYSHENLLFVRAEGNRREEDRATPVVVNALSDRLDRTESRGHLE
jgi:hypothetical protein